MSKYGEPTLEYGFEIVEMKGGYLVQLPHQCQEWTIPGGDIDPETRRWVDDFSKEGAIQAMETFIAEATLTLERLRAIE